MAGRAPARAGTDDNRPAVGSDLPAAVRRHPASAGSPAAARAAHPASILAFDGIDTAGAPRMRSFSARADAAPTRRGGAGEQHQPADQPNEGQIEQPQ